MFIVEPIKKDKATGELKALYRMIEKSLGFIPPHFELFATLDLEALKEFMEYNLYFVRHKKIDADLLPYLRLYIAQHECRNYCIDLNSKMLLNKGVDKKIIYDIAQNIDNISLANDQKTVFKKVIKGIYSSDEFTKDDLIELHDEGFSNKDFYDLLNYGTSFMGRSKMIEVFLSHENN